MNKMWKTITAVIAVLALMAGTAAATHVFDDVEDGAFYAAATEWAKDNEVTLGCGDNNFCPERGVTRGENITFAYRYDQNVVQPALEEIDTKAEEVDEALATLEASLSTVAYAQGPFVNNWDGTPIVLSYEFVAPSDGFLIIRYAVNVGRDVDASPTDGSTRVNANISVDGDTQAEGVERWVNEISPADADADVEAQLNAIARNFNIEAVVPVTAGSNLVAGQVGSDTVAYLWGTTLTTQFVSDGVVYTSANLGADAGND